MNASSDFPRLTPLNHRETSPSTSDYNCVAWAAGDEAHWWQPGVYWPADSPRDDFGIGILERAFAELGYIDCQTDDSMETSVEKVALYGTGAFYTHAARQLQSGKWTSKLGRDVDIEHDTPDVVAGGVYGEVVQILKRARD